MSFLIFILSVLLTHASLTESQARCGSSAPNELYVYQDDFLNSKKYLDSAWWWTAPELESKYQEVYQSGKRLPKRAYYQPAINAFVLPLRVGAEIKEVLLSENFILSVRKHIELALKNQYVKQIFFPDMGHSHLYFKQEHWDAFYSAPFSLDKKAELYQRMLSDPELFVLYHTAEQLMTNAADGSVLSDPELEFRYWNRNLVGDNKQGDALTVYVSKETKYNTVSGIDGYRLWSSGFNISASKEGCFPFEFKNQTFYFDISLEDLIPNPAIPREYTER